ncbi:hypothetical protein C2E23DRAFT_309646 [Lenzites betulinus]|nr:hypothetical protein C2E23DRAFT_309646 [Lenzites betulinus]
MLTLGSGLLLSAVPGTYGDEWAEVDPYCTRDAVLIARGHVLAGRRVEVLNGRSAYWRAIGADTGECSFNVFEPLVSHSMRCSRHEDMRG